MSPLETFVIVIKIRSMKKSRWLWMAKIKRDQSGYPYTMVDVVPQNKAVFC